jgi:hypothetical protein
MNQYKEQTQEEFQDDVDEAIVMFAMDPDGMSRLNVALPSVVRFDMSVDDISENVKRIVLKRLKKSKHFA